MANEAGRMPRSRDTAALPPWGRGVHQKVYAPTVREIRGETEPEGPGIRYRALNRQPLSESTIDPMIGH